MKVDAQTVVCATIANPNRQSLAPTMHNAGFEALKLNYVYVAFEPTDLPAAFAAFRTLGIRNVSISQPFKVSALALVDEIDPAAHDIGAINTVVLREGRLRGYNSDWIGGLAALAEVVEVHGRTAALLGAGGAARALAYGLRQAGADVTVFNRTAERRARLAAELGVRDGGDLDRAGRWRGDIVVNATVAGSPGVAELAVSEELFAATPVVMDVVIRPQPTALVERARTFGCPVVTGDRMLVHQGAFQFRLFTGVEAPLDVMAEAVRATV